MTLERHSTSGRGTIPFLDFRDVGVYSWHISLDGVELD